MHRRASWLFVLVLAGGLGGFTAFWYAASGESRGSLPAFGGFYVEGVAGAPSRINPLFAGQNEVDRALVSLVFSGLTRLDESGRPFPDLAEAWELTPDGRTYTFRLRRGVVWHDGAPFSADDVVFTYALLKSPALRSPPALARILADATVKKVDAFTIRIELTQPYAPLLAYLTFGILPQHILGQTSPDALFDAPFNLRPVGAGPYRLEQLGPDRAVLAANAAYHLGQPFIQRLEMRFFRDDGAVMTALRARQLDGAFFARGLTGGDFAYLEGRRDLTVSQLASGEVSFLYFNLRNPLFQDRRVRQALLYALDRDALVQETVSGQSARADSPLPEGTWAFQASMARYQPDPGLANLLLDEAGFKVTPGGVRASAAGRLAFTLATNNDPVRVAVAQAVAERWEAVGVDVAVEAGGTTTLVRDLLEPRAFQVALFAYRAEPDPDPYAAWHSSQSGSSDRNVSSLADVRIDRLLEDARQIPDQARRTELYRDFQELFAQEVPAIPLFSSLSVYVQKKGLKGVRPGYLVDAGSRFWQVQDWYLRTR